MLYSLEQGPVEQSVIKQCLRDGRPLPEKIRNAPSLYMGLELYYSAFFELHTCRSVGMSEQAISWLSIQNYCDRLKLSDEQREDMVYHIMNMDNAYLAWRLKNQE